MGQRGKHVVHSIGGYFDTEVQFCFYVQDVLEPVTRKEEGREREMEGRSER